MGMVTAESVAGSKPKMLLVLSHMRSYSTLLTHILHDNPDIFGWHELHRSYPSERIVEQTIQQQLKATSASFACDNLLHSRYSIGEDVLDSDRVTWIISVRTAGPTLNSLWRWGGPGNRYRQPGTAARYYIDRVQQLERLGTQLAGRFILLRSDRLINHPNDTLDQLSKGLELSVPLRSTYDPDDGTGSPRFGDFSKYIGKGEIVSKRSYKSRPQIPATDIRRCRRARGRALASLRDNAKLVV